MFGKPSPPRIHMKGIPTHNSTIYFMVLCSLPKTLDVQKV